MACNCNISCDCDDIVQRVGPKGPDGPDVTGPAGGILVGNDGEQGPKGPDGEDAEHYDSGWKQLNDHNGTFGIAPVNGEKDLCIRVINTKLFLMGTFLIPLSSDGGLALYDNYTLYGIDNAGANFIQTYLGSNGGFTTTDGDYMETNTPIIPADLCPDLQHVMPAIKFIERGINPQGDPGKGVTLSTIFQAIELTTDGKLVVKTNEYDPTLGTAKRIHNSPYHKFMSNVGIGNKIGTYDNVEAGLVPQHVWSSAYPEVLDVDTAVITVTPNIPSKSYPSTFKANNPNHLGGFEVIIQTTYPIGRTKTQQEIKDAFNSI